MNKNEQNRRLRMALRPSAGEYLTDRGIRGGVRYGKPP